MGARRVLANAVAIAVLLLFAPACVLSNGAHAAKRCGARRQALVGGVPASR